MFSLDYLTIGLKSAFVSGKPVIVSITSNLRLHLNDRLLSNECTSFQLTQNFLLFTNTTAGIMHELHIYDLNRVLPANHTSIAKITDDGNFNVRAVERGARLVTCCGSRVVL